MPGTVMAYRCISKSFDFLKSWKSPTFETIEKDALEFRHGFCIPDILKTIGDRYV